MSKHREQLVGALFDVLDTQGHSEAQQLLLKTYQSHATTDREELLDQLVADLVTILHRELTPQEEVDILTTTVEYVVNRFVSVIEVAPVAIVVVGDDGAIQLWNQGATRIFGWEESSVLGEFFVQLFQDTSDTVASSVSQLEEGEHLTGIETQCHHRDGSLLDVRLWAAPLYNHDDTFTGATFVISDISAQKQREQRLTVLNRVLRHNIRNDITVIQGHLELIADTIGKDNEHIETIERHLENVVSLSNRARQIEKLRDTEKEEALTTFSLDSVVDNRLTRLQQNWPAVHIDTPSQQPAPAVAHELLPYAIDNLLENAVEHNNSDPARIRVELSESSCNPATHISLVIEDNGPGLPDIEKKVLTAETETALSHSTGIGIWLTRWIIRSSGGSLHVDAGRFDGTRITIELRRPDCPGSYSE
ncbi:PAS domain S-box protein [Halovenus rubra]|uniref:histidine kinase n=2 Tax=Halovenus rubra TaxID=869890 RepID=A0ABD5X7E0_9EURY|nr:PAS domain S-box protein [Halovenus rubra]